MEANLLAGEAHVKASDFMMLSCTALNDLLFHILLKQFRLCASRYDTTQMHHSSSLGSVSLMFDKDLAFF